MFLPNVCSPLHRGKYSLSGTLLSLDINIPEAATNKKKQYSALSPAREKCRYNSALPFSLLS